MLQTITAKLQILPNTEYEHQLLHCTMKAYMQGCNYVSASIFQTHNLVQSQINNHLYYDLRNEFNLRSQMAQSVIKTVIASYKTIQENQKEWIRPDFSKPQLDLVWNRDYSLIKSENLFSVNTLEGRIKVKFYSKGFEQYFTENCKFGTAKLVFKHNKFFLHIPVTYEVHEPQISEITNVVGIDRGIRFAAVTYDSNGKTMFYSGKQLKQKRAHYKHIRKQLQSVGTPSSRHRLKQIGQRENRWVNDVNHCISKALVESHPANTLFVMEDLTGIRSATEKVHLKDRYVSVSWPYYDLELKINYKAIRNNQSTLKIHPAYTSQRCPKCGHIEKSNRIKKKHLFCCKNCGYTSNDDRVAAMNIQFKGFVAMLQKSDMVETE